MTAVQTCKALLADTILVHAVSDEEESVVQQKTNILQLGCLEVHLASDGLPFIFKVCSCKGCNMEKRVF